MGQSPWEISICNFSSLTQVKIEKEKVKKLQCLWVINVKFHLAIGSKLPVRASQRSVLRLWVTISLLYFELSMQTAEARLDPGTAMVMGGSRLLETEIWVLTAILCKDWAILFRYPPCPGAQPPGDGYTLIEERRKKEPGLDPRTSLCGSFCLPGVAVLKTDT